MIRLRDDAGAVHWIDPRRVLSLSGSVGRTTLVLEGGAALQIAASVDTVAVDIDEALSAIYAYRRDLERSHADA